MFRLPLTATVIFALSIVSAAQAGEVVLDGLKNPSGIAVQPETGVVFVSDSAPGRIVRVVEGNAQEDITGSSTDTYGKGPKHTMGPTGVACLGQDRLAVADPGVRQGDESLRAS